MLRNRFYSCRCFVATNEEVLYRCEVSVSDYIFSVIVQSDIFVYSEAKTN